MKRGGLLKANPSILCFVTLLPFRQALHSRRAYVLGPHFPSAFFANALPLPFAATLGKHGEGQQSQIIAASSSLQETLYQAIVPHKPVSVARQRARFRAFPAKEATRCFPLRRIHSQYQQRARTGSAVQRREVFKQRPFKDLTDRLHKTVQCKLSRSFVYNTYIQSLLHAIMPTADLPIQVPKTLVKGTPGEGGSMKNNETACTFSSSSFQARKLSHLPRILLSIPLLPI